MRVERETAGFALPFTAGVLLAVYSGYHPGASHQAAYLAAFITVSLALILLMHPSRRKMSFVLPWLLTCLAALGTGMICGFTSVDIGLGESHTGILHTIRNRAAGYGLRIQEAIDSIPFRDRSSNAIAKALITGERSDIPKDLIRAFRESGASHILALSGLHLGIIYGIVRGLLSAFGNHHRIRVLRSAMIVATCGFYTMATGAGPSIVRAFLFILLAEAATLCHRHRSTGQILMAALIIQLTFSPASAKSAGFQLSYAAMAGIAFIFPWLKSLWPGEIHDDRLSIRGMRKIWETCAMSISCQMTTAPLAWAYFGTMPKHFLLTNLLALPLTALTVPAILITLLMVSTTGCPDMMIATTETLISCLIRLLEIISEM